MEIAKLLLFAVVVGIVLGLILVAATVALDFMVSRKQLSEQSGKPG